MNVRPDSLHECWLELKEIMNYHEEQDLFQTGQAYDEMPYEIFMCFISDMLFPQQDLYMCIGKVK